MFEMSGHWVNTGMRMLSPFAASSVANVLLQSVLEFINIPKRHPVDTLLHDSQTL